MTLPGDITDRPIIGGNRPGGGGNGWPNRPGWNGGGINIGNGNNIINNNHNNTIINNNNWFGGRNNFWGGNNGWGWGNNHGHWGDYWYDHHVNLHHHGWYHGAWCGNWGASWYSPFVYGATAWGLAATLPSWGYSYSYAYSNPYYVAADYAATAPAYDYSQPIVINTYNTPTSDASATASPEQATTTTQESTATQDSAASKEGYANFDAARESFTKGDYANALKLDEQAIGSVPNDPVLHEFGALCLFAQGDYKRAAAVLNAVLAVAPGMDWTTMSSLYPNVDVYTQQLRKLEAATNDNPDDAAARFVLAYHYLVVGHTDAAIGELQAVVAKQPGDRVAQRMLEALKPPATEEPKTESTPPAESPKPAAEGATSEAAAGAESGTDLIGAWKAERDGTAFDLNVDEQGNFVWKVAPKEGKPVEISGPIAATSDTVILESKDQGTMVAKVKSVSADEFQFLVSGSPPDDLGLTFKRVK